MQAGVCLLVADVMPIYMTCLDILITMLNSVNCSTVIFSSTVEYLCSWDKPLVKPMAPGSIFYRISFPSTLICIFYFPIYIIKIPKIFTLSYYLYQISLSQVAWRDWQALYCVGCEVLVCLCRCMGLLRSLLLDWYHGSQELREILTLLLLHHPLLFEENQRKLKM